MRVLPLISESESDLFTGTIHGNTDCYLRALAEKGQKRISLVQAREIGRECQITDDATLFKMLSEYNNIGFLLWCSDEEQARELVVLLYHNIHQPT
jgi:hypothetical protein